MRENIYAEGMRLNEELKGVEAPGKSQVLITHLQRGTGKLFGSDAT